MSEIDLIKRATTYCQLGKHRMTEPRKRVLSLLASARSPMGAYQILKALSSNSKKINPPTIYRAIEFWLQHGFIHRIQSLGTYISCREHLHHENFCIFVCDVCHMVIELEMPALPKNLATDIKQKHLAISGIQTEIRGTCSHCSQ